VVSIAVIVHMVCVVVAVLGTLILLAVALYPVIVLGLCPKGLGSYVEVV
jgi:hypothetical protein